MKDIYKSQYGQDEYLDKKLFREKENGIFIDIGANDGVMYSNTWFFEKKRNWKGICIEPIPATYKKLQANRNSINVNGCIASSSGNLKFLQVSGYAEMLSGLIDHYDEKHLARIDKEIAEHGGSKEIIEVVSYHVNDLARQNHFDKIDYCSIDTEGNELAILKSIDFDQLPIEVLSVENNYQGPEMEKFMKSKGYRLIKRLICDEIYVLKNKWPAWKLW